MQLLDGDRLVPTTMTTSDDHNLGRETITLRSKPWSSDGFLSRMVLIAPCSRVPASLALLEVWIASAS